MGKNKEKGEGLTSEEQKQLKKLLQIIEPIITTVDELKQTVAESRTLEATVEFFDATKDFSKKMETRINQDPIQDAYRQIKKSYRQSGLPEILSKIRKSLPKNFEKVGQQFHESGLPEAFGKFQKALVQDVSELSERFQKNVASARCTEAEGQVRKEQIVETIANLNEKLQRSGIPETLAKLNEQLKESGIQESLSKLNDQLQKSGLIETCERLNAQFKKDVAGMKKKDRKD